MPAVHSTLKDSIYGREWSFPYNCYEVGHGWTPFCTGAAFDVGMAAFKNVMPLYTSLYLFTQLGLQRNMSAKSFLETLKSVATSASFIGFQVYIGMLVSCGLRNNSDRYYYRVQCFLPGFIAAYSSMFIERPSRRPALAFYVANMASELVFKWAVARGFIVALPHGETLLFSAGIACWMRFLQIHGFGHDPVSTAMKMLVGPNEAKSRAKNRKATPIECPPHQTGSGELAAIEGTETSGSKQAQERAQQVAPAAVAKSRSPAFRVKGIDVIEDTMSSLLNLYFVAHPACPHQGISCADYAVTPLFSRFLLGYLGGSALNVAKNAPQLLRSPAQVVSEALTSRSSVNLGLFLSTFVGSLKATHCLLRRLSGSRQVWHSAVAGGLAGTSMLFSPKSTLSTYIIWKCLEQYFFLGVEKGVIKYPNQVIAIVYAVSVEIMLYMFALWPRFIRPSYMKFIDQVSDHRLHQLNRMVLDVFGTDSSVGYEDWFPDLDPQYMTREFQELIFNWLIQPFQ